MRTSLLSAALVAALVGYGSTVALVLAAAAALGATEAQAASWLLAVCLAKAIGSAGLSLWTRVPVVLAWSTPGAALIAATEGISLPEATGAFIAAGALIALCGLVRPLGRWIARLPAAIAAAMLAGVLMPFCLRLAPAAGDLPAVVLPMVLVFLAVRRADPALAVLAALGTGLAGAWGAGLVSAPAAATRAPGPVLVIPAWDPAVLIGLGVPLALVTMASQNLPGFATLRAAGYAPPVARALTVTGLLSMAGALFGGHTVNMAAITAAICLGPDVHPDPARRWRVGLVYGAVWVGLGLLGPLVVATIAALPAPLVAGTVAIALLAPLSGALAGAFAGNGGRMAPTVTLAVTASGVAVFGIGAAFWGLLAGLAVHLAEGDGGPAGSAR
jgi:benzoate membrane transport protein